MGEKDWLDGMEEQRGEGFDHWNEEILLKEGRSDSGLDGIEGETVTRNDNG